MDIRTLTEQTLGFTFPCPIREMTAEGLYVHYENGQAEVGGSTVPALARAYMLLAKGLSADRTNDPGGRYRDLVRPPAFSSGGSAGHFPGEPGASPAYRGAFYGADSAGFRSRGG